jgi:hypothetical protein
VRTLSAGSTLAVGRQYAEPHYLIALAFTAPSALTLYLSDHYVEVFGHEWLPYVADWGTLEEVLNTADVGGQPATAQLSLFNTKPIAGKSRVSDLIRTPLNTSGTYEWGFAQLTVYHYFDNLVSSPDQNRLGVFYLEEPTEIGESLLVVRMSDQTLVIDRALAVRKITRSDFPACAPSSVNRDIPRAFGVVAHVPCWPVVDGAAGQLLYATTPLSSPIPLVDATDFGRLADRVNVEKLYGTTYWTHTGLGAFDASRVNDGELLTAAFTLTTATVGAVLRFYGGTDPESGQPEIRTFVGVRIQLGATNSPTGQWTIEHSEDGVSWTTITTLNFGSGATQFTATWADVGAHSLWRLRLTTAPSSTQSSHVEVQWIERLWQGQIEQEQIQWRTVVGNELRTVSRGVGGTTSLAHDAGARVFQIFQGSKAYRYVVAEETAGFPIQAITNIRINDQAATVATAELGVTDLAAGRRFAVINVNVSDLRAFHTTTVAAHSLSLPIATNLPLALDQTIDSVGNSTWQFLLTVTLQPPAEPYTVTGTVSRHVVMTFTQPSGSFSLSGTNTIRHRDPNNGTLTLFTDNAGPGFDFTGATYDYTTGANITNETFELNLSGDADNWRFIWTITVYTLSSATVASVPQVGYATGKGSGDSTTAIVIGDVTCDIEGTRDDTSGSISGTANLLLENPVDIVRFALLHLWPGITSGQLGASFATTRASLASAGIKWAFLMGFEDFAKWRLRFGEQARSVFYLTAGTWEYKYLPDAPSAQQTLDYAREVSLTAPALVSRTARVDVKNSLAVASQYDYVDRTYKTLATVEDLTQIGLTERLAGQLNLDLVRDPAAAAALGAFWLSRWKRQRFLVDLVAWWNVLAVELVDYLAFVNHPILEAHGGAALVFRVLAKRALLADEQTGRIRLQLIEAGT